jgi:hypothetical protein
MNYGTQTTSWSELETADHNYIFYAQEQQGIRNSNSFSQQQTVSCPGTLGVGDLAADAQPVVLVLQWPLMPDLLLQQSVTAV